MGSYEIGICRDAHCKSNSKDMTCIIFLTAPIGLITTHLLNTFMASVEWVHVGPLVSPNDALRLIHPNIVKLKEAAGAGGM